MAAIWWHDLHTPTYRVAGGFRSHKRATRRQRPSDSTCHSNPDAAGNQRRSMLRRRPFAPLLTIWRLGRSGTMFALIPSGRPASHGPSARHFRMTLRMARRRVGFSVFITERGPHSVTWESTVLSITGTRRFSFDGQAGGSTTLVSDQKTFRSPVLTGAALLPSPDSSGHVTRFGSRRSSGRPSWCARGSD